LRANEAKLRQETLGLYAEITKLRSVLAKDWTEASAAVECGESTSATEATFGQDSITLSIEPTTSRITHQQIRVQRERGIFPPSKSLASTPFGSQSHNQGYSNFSHRMYYCVFQKSRWLTAGCSASVADRTTRSYSCVWYLDHTSCRGRTHRHRNGLRCQV
jgi:hypothetical protein